MARFVVVGSSASATGDYRLDDLPATSGRLDVLLRATRAALMVSHGLRREVVVYLVLGGGPGAPRALRIDGATVKFLRPDERSLAILIQKTLKAARPRAGGLDASGFIELRPGLALAEAGLDAVLADLGEAVPYVLDERGSDLRAARIDADRAVFFLGDHRGFDAGTLDRLERLGAGRLSVGPLSLHSEDVVSVLSNELDRRSTPERSR